MSYTYNKLTINLQTCTFTMSNTDCNNGPNNVSETFRINIAKLHLNAAGINTIINPYTESAINIPDNSLENVTIYAESGIDATTTYFGTPTNIILQSIAETCLCAQKDCPPAPEECELTDANSVTAMISQLQVINMGGTPVYILHTNGSIGNKMRACAKLDTGATKYCTDYYDVSVNKIPLLEIMNKAAANGEVVVTITLQVMNGCTAETSTSITENDASIG